MSDFPSRVYVTLEKDASGAETLCVAFAAEDCEGDVVGVYELTGTLERRFVETKLEQRADGSA